MAIEKVVVSLQDDSTLEDVKNAIKNGNEVMLENDLIVVYVHDSNDPAEEVCGLLNKAGIIAFVE